MPKDEKTASPSSLRRVVECDRGRREAVMTVKRVKRWWRGAACMSGAAIGLRLAMLIARMAYRG